MTTYERVNRKERSFLQKGLDGKHELFTSHSITKSCNISRSTLLRLEERGLLKPAYVKEDSGYRYYDVQEAGQIMQIKLLQELGLSYDDIGEYYASGGSSPAVAERLRKRLELLKRGVEELELRNRDSYHMTAEIVTLPDFYCYTGEFKRENYMSTYWGMYETYHEAISKGYQPLATEPIFGLAHRTDYLEGHIDDAPYRVTCCVPLDPKCVPKDAVFIKGGKAVSVLHYGPYESLEDAYLLLGQKVRELGLKAVGPLRNLGVVAPAIGKSIADSNYVSRIAVLVEE